MASFLDFFRKKTAPEQELPAREQLPPKTQTERDADAVRRWIIASGKPEFTGTEISRGMRSHKAGKSERIKPALALLKERQYLRIIQKQSSGVKPINIYQVHPELIGGEW